MSVLSVLNQTNGRDKVARFVQYLCRTLSYMKQNAISADDYKILEATLSTFRKLLRFGRSLESLHFASKLMDDGDIIKRLTALIKITHGCFLFCDHIEILGKLRIINVNAKEWNLTANRYWLLTDVLNLVQNYFILRESCKVLKRSNELRSTSSIKYLLPIYLDILKNLFDIFLPLCTLNIVELNPGSTGILGMISSLLGLLLLLKPFSKMT